MWQMKMFISVYTVFKDIVQIFSIVLALAALWAVCMQALRAHILSSTLTSLHMDTKLEYYPKLNPNITTKTETTFPKP